MVRRNDLYRCEPVKPWVECGEGRACPKGTICGAAMVPQMCVKCSDTIARTWYETQAIVTNVTAAMLAGNQWQTNSFYNHTGVDLILTLYVYIQFALFCFVF